MRLSELLQDLPKRCSVFLALIMRDSARSDRRSRVPGKIVRRPRERVDAIRVRGSQTVGA